MRINRKKKEGIEGGKINMDINIKCPCGSNCKAIGVSSDFAKVLLKMWESVHTKEHRKVYIKELKGKGEK